VDEIFGVPMTTIMLTVLAIMGLCLLTTVVIYLRNRVIFSMAVRNIPRRKAQTVLIMVGLMLATLIIAASLTTGDTLDHSITSSTYEGLGQTDETIAFAGEADADAEISVTNPPVAIAIVEQLETRLADDPHIQAFLPMLTVDVPIINPDTRLSEPSIIITGIDPARIAAFDTLRSPEGAAIDFSTVPPGSGVISEDLAEQIDADIGNQLTFYYDNQPYSIEVAAIATGSILTGFSSVGESTKLLGIATPLPWLQSVTGLDGQVRFIAVSNTGGVEDGMDRTDVVMLRLESALEDIEGGDHLGVNPIKQDAIEGAQFFSNVIMSAFMMLGMFSVAAGVLLIFLIFMMLAAERRPEMGMARAVGMKRRHLIQSFTVEGTVYDLGAALLGAAAGVGVAFAITRVMASLLGDFVAITPHASFRSLIVAYALGVSVTFLTIVFASVRASRVNIVQAIRDLPEIQTRQQLRPQRHGWRPDRLVRHNLGLFRYYVGWSPILTVVGVLLMIQGGAGHSMFVFSLGLSLAALGIALILSRFLPQRLVYTIVAAVMLGYWLAPDGLLDPILPRLEGDVEMFFLSGIMMVTFATLIIMWNAEVIVWLISLFGRVAPRWLPAVKTAVAYPLASKGRTGMTIAMFSLVIFALVTMTTINRNFAALFSTEDADAGWAVMVTTNPNNPVPDLIGALRTTPRNEVDTDHIVAVGRLSGTDWSSSRARFVGGAGDEWQDYQLNGMDQTYIEHAEIPLQSRAIGYESDAAVWEAVRSDPALAVVDSWALGDQALFSGSFAPRELEILNTRSGQTDVITVVGVIDAKVSSLSGLLIHEERFMSLFDQPDTDRRYVKLKTDDREQAVTMAKQIESALLERGVQAIAIDEMIEQFASIQRGFLQLIQGFMGLGLLVGIAALGVISFRSVVERRQQIGMLRAIGYQKTMVATSFLLESLVVAILGLLSGTVMAVILSYNLITSDEFSEGAAFTGFVIPWDTISLFVGASLLASAVMTWIPARAASSVPIAEALRYE